MKNILIKVFTSFLTITLVLNSCVSSNKIENTGLKRTNEQKVFKTKSEFPLENSDGDFVDVVGQNSTNSMKVILSNEFPKNMAVDYSDVSFTPASLSIENTPPALTPEEIEQNKIETLEAWTSWFKELYKKLKQQIRNKHKLEFKNLKETYEQKLKNFHENSSQKKLLKDEFERKKHELEKRYKEVKKELKKWYKDGLVQIKEKIYNQYPQNLTFKTKSAIDECSSWGIFGFLCVLPPVLAVAGVIDGIKSISKSNPPPPIAKPSPVNNNNQVVNSNGEAMPQANITSVNNQSIAPSQKIEAATVGTKFANLPKSSKAFLEKILDMVQNPELNKVAIIFSTDALFRAIGLQIDRTNVSCNTSQEIQRGISLGDMSGIADKITQNCTDAYAVAFLNGLKDNFGTGFSGSYDYSGQYYSLSFNFLDETQSDHENGNTSTVDWLKYVIEKSDPQYYQSNKTLVDSALNKLRNSKLSIEIKSPKICSQGTTITYEQSELLSFQSIIKSKSLLYDGDYTITLKIGNTIVETKQVNIARGLKREIKDYPWKTATNEYYQREFTYSDRPLAMFDAISKPSNGTSYTDSELQETLNNPGINLYLTNDTGNLWDLNIYKVFDNPSSTCKVYSSACMDVQKTLFKLNTINYRSGFYNLRTGYSSINCNDYNYPDDYDNCIKNKNGYSLRGKNNDYNFVVLNPEFSSFTLFTDKPQETDLFGNYDNNLLPLSFEGNSIYEDIDQGDNLEDEIKDPSELDLPSQIPNGISDIPGTKVISKSLVYFNAKDQTLKDTYFPKNSYGTNSAKNLFVELTNDNFKSFKLSQGGTCFNGKFMTVGAVVSLTGGSGSNEKLKNIDETIPMILSLEKFDPSSNKYNIVKNWNFNAKIGSKTIVQRYWDGHESPYYDESEFPLYPTYQAGSYRVNVSVNYDFLDLQRLSERFGGAYVPYPITTKTSKIAGADISNTSTNQDNSCQNNCLQNTTLKNNILQKMDQSISGINNIIATDLPELYALAGDFSTASIQVSKPTIGEYTIIDTNIKNINEELEKIKKAILECNNNKIQIASKDIEDSLKKISEITPKYPELKQIINISKEIFKIRLTDILLDVIFLKNHNVETPEEERLLQWIELVSELMVEGTFVKLKTINSECKINGEPTKLRDHAKLVDIKTNEALAKLSELTANLGLGSFSTIENELKILMEQAFPYIFKIGNDISFECDRCEKITNITDKIKCKLCSMSQEKRDRFRETFEIRKVLINKLQTRNYKETEERVVAFGKIINGSNKPIVVSISGENDYIKSITGEITYNYKGQTRKATVAPLPNNSKFETRKTNKQSGLTNYSDAEIKIFDYVDKNFVGTTIIESVFSDRVTCEYCQDVVRRIKKGNKYVSPSNVNEVQKNDSIFANFTLVDVDGGPFFGASTFKFSDTNNQKIQEVLDNESNLCRGY